MNNKFWEQPSRALLLLGDNDWFCILWQKNISSVSGFIYCHRSSVRWVFWQRDWSTLAERLVSFRQFCCTELSFTGLHRELHALLARKDCKMVKVVRKLVKTTRWPDSGTWRSDPRTTLAKMSVESHKSAAPTARDASVLVRKLYTGQTSKKLTDRTKTSLDWNPQLPSAGGDDLMFVERPIRLVWTPRAISPYLDCSKSIW